MGQSLNQIEGAPSLNGPRTPAGGGSGLTGSGLPGPGGARDLSWEEVPGWLSRAEGEALRVLAAGKRVLEIGSWKGRSTVAMAQVARHVTSVDHHSGDRNTGPADTLAEFLANLHRFDVKHKVTELVCRVSELPPGPYRDPYDLAFIDGEHTVEATLEALEAAKKSVKPGGIIAWHDADYPEVIEAVAKAGLSPLAGIDKLEWAVHI